MIKNFKQNNIVKTILPASILFFSANASAALITDPVGAADINIEGAFNIGSAVTEGGSSVFGLKDGLDNGVFWGDPTGVPGGASSYLTFTSFSYDTSDYNLVDGWTWNGAALVEDTAADGYISKTQYDALSGIITPKLELDSTGFNTGDFALLGQFEFFNGQILADSGISSVDINVDLLQPGSFLGNQSTGALTINIENTPNACDTTLDPNCAYDGISIALVDGGVEQNIFLTEWLIQEDGTETALFWGQIGSLLPAPITGGSGDSVTAQTDDTGTKTITDSSGNTTVVSVPAPGALALLLMGLPLLLTRKRK